MEDGGTLKCASLAWESVSRKGEGKDPDVVLLNESIEGNNYKKDLHQ